MSLTRANFRNLWLLVSVLLIGGGWFMFQKAQERAQDVDRVIRTINQLRIEKNNQQALANALQKLDSLTLDERNATRLDILRHLDLQATGYKFRLQDRQGEEEGGITLYTRKFTLNTTLPYSQALNLADKLHNNPKVVLDTYKLSRVTLLDDIYGDAVQLELHGTLYGLEKQ